MDKQRDFFASIQTGTESFLSWRKRRAAEKREKQRAKNPIVDWIEAFFWAAGVVLLVNQYLFQAYQIPSGSMIDTLLIGDRIFVNKLVYGPELLPGLVKIPSPIRAEREEVIIFENPEYEKRGPLFDIVQRVLYMLTLSLVDIDRDAATGEPRPHFLIKRAAALGGDQLRLVDGELLLRHAGETRWVPERDYVEGLGLEHHISRLINADDYPRMRHAARAIVLARNGLVGRPSYAGNADHFAVEEAIALAGNAINPQDEATRELIMRHQLGWYVSEARVFPMGDNRDNSKDARFFGAVRRDKVLGQALIKYWPLSRFGGIR